MLLMLLPLAAHLLELPWGLGSHVLLDVVVLAVSFQVHTNHVLDSKACCLHWLHDSLLLDTQHPHKPAHWRLFFMTTDHRNLWSYC